MEEHVESFRLNRILKKLRFPGRLIQIFLPEVGEIVRIGNVVFVVTFVNVGKRRIAMEVRGWIPPTTEEHQEEYADG